MTKLVGVGCSIWKGKVKVEAWIKGKNEMKNVFEVSQTGLETCVCGIGNYGKPLMIVDTLIFQLVLHKTSFNPYHAYLVRYRPGLETIECSSYPSIHKYTVITFVEL